MYIWFWQINHFWQDWPLHRRPSYHNAIPVKCVNYTLSWNYMYVIEKTCILYHSIDIWVRQFIWLLIIGKMNKEDKDTLRRNHMFLLEHLPSDDIADYFYQHNLFTENDREEIQVKKDSIFICRGGDFFLNIFFCFFLGGVVKL